MKDFCRGGNGLEGCGASFDHRFRGNRGGVLGDESAKTGLEKGCGDGNGYSAAIYQILFGG